jgi:predicted PurR-regulated permease PerM
MTTAAKTIDLKHQLLFWTAVFAVIIGLMWLLGDVLLPFVAGMAIAYLCNPLTNRLETWRIPRWLGATIVLTLVLLFFVLLFLLIAPIIGSQLTGFMHDLPNYIAKLHALITDPSRPWLSKIAGETLPGGDTSPADLIRQASGLIAAFLAKVWSGGSAVLAVFSLLVITPVVAFYFIVDWPRLVVSMERLIPRSQHDTIVQLASQIDAAIAGFVRGQTIVCVILGVLYAASLSAVGLKFGLLIGLVSGLISFIPYVGSVTGFVLATGIALAQFWPDWIWIGVVIGIFLAGQFIEGNILVPKLVGDSIGLHPLWLMFALFAFGYLFGFLGLLLAVPMAAAVGVLVRFGVDRYLHSPLYGKR